MHQLIERASNAAFVLVALTAVSPVLAAFDYVCGGPAKERALSEPYEMKATRLPGETDEQLANRVRNDLESIWAAIPDCPSCPVAGACAPKAEMVVSSKEVLPNPVEPEVRVKYYGGKVLLSCTECPEFPQ
jgi:hypothetical protein